MAFPLIGAIISRIGARAMLSGARVASRVGAEKTAAALMQKRAANLSAQYASQAMKPPPLPSGYAPKPGIMQRLADRMQRVLDRNTPVADQVRDLTVPQRMQRLQQMGDLMSKAEVGRQLLTPNPTPEQIVESSEQQQEQRRLEQQEKLQGSGARLSKKMLFAGGVLGPLVAPQLPRAMQKFAEHLMEANREFARLTPALAGVFARMERQDIHLAARTGAATAGGATKLGEAIMRLKEDTQPIREIMVRAKNALGMTLVKMANLVVRLIEESRLLDAIELIIQAIEWWFEIQNEEHQGNRPWDNMFADIAAGRFNNPTNRAPQPPGGN